MHDCLISMVTLYYPQIARSSFCWNQQRVKRSSFHILPPLFLLSALPRFLLRLLPWLLPRLPLNFPSTSPYLTLPSHIPSVSLGTTTSASCPSAPFLGYIASTQDALLLFEACLRDTLVVPCRLFRERVNDQERERLYLYGAGFWYKALDGRPTMEPESIIGQLSYLPRARTTLSSRRQEESQKETDPPQFAMNKINAEGHFPGRGHTHTVGGICGKMLQVHWQSKISRPLSEHGHTSEEEV
jgi:hypothetical protein